jgi:hypothetical protein
LRDEEMQNNDVPFIDFFRCCSRLSSSLFRQDEEEDEEEVEELGNAVRTAGNRIRPWNMPRTTTTIIV